MQAGLEGVHIDVTVASSDGPETPLREGLARLPAMTGRIPAEIHRLMGPGLDNANLLRPLFREDGIITCRARPPLLESEVRAPEA